MDDVTHTNIYIYILQNLLFDASALRVLLIQLCSLGTEHFVPEKCDLCLNFPWSADVGLQKEQTQRSHSNSPCPPPRALPSHCLSPKRFDFCLFHFVVMRTKELKMTPRISPLSRGNNSIKVANARPGTPSTCRAQGVLGHPCCSKEHFIFYPFPHECLEPPWGMFDPVKTKAGRFLRNSCVNK